MRPGQHPSNKRMRGRNNGGHNRGKGPNPLSRVHESNGPDVKIRGTVHHIIEKYMQLGRDAQASGDRVMAENYYQHADHYFRVLMAAQQQVAPHMMPSIRVDDQPYDEEGDEEEGGQRGSDVEAAAAGLVPSPSGAEDDREQPRYEHQNRGRSYGERQPYPPRQHNASAPAAAVSGQMNGEHAEASEQPAIEFPERGEGRGGGERAPRMPRSESFRRDDMRREPREERHSEAADISLAPEPVRANGAPSEGREPGLPSFLTRGRRRGRPAYRRSSTEAGESGDGAGEVSSPAADKVGSSPSE